MDKGNATPMSPTGRQAGRRAGGQADPDASAYLKSAFILARSLCFSGPAMGHAPALMTYYCYHKTHNR